MIVRNTNGTNRTAGLAMVVLLALGVTLGAASSAHADFLYWKGGSGILFSNNWYNDTTNVDDTPQSSVADELRVGANGTVTFSTNFTTSVVRVGHEVNPDAMALAGSGTMTQNGATLTTNNFLHIGQVGNAGVYNLNLGTIQNNNDFFQLGFNAMGTLNQAGGTINTNLMNLGTEDIGNGRGDGTLVMTSGAVNVVGRTTGTPIAGGLRVGRQGDGLLDMSTGNGVLTANFIAVSDFAGSIGEMRVGGTSQVILNNNDRFIIGWGRNTTTGARSDGTLNMTGGSITLQTTTTGTPTANLADFVVGWSGVAELMMSGGTIDVGRRFTSAIDGADPSFPTPRSEATINHSGGTINAVEMWIAEGGEAEYNLSGTGLVNLTDRLILGVNSPGGVNAQGTLTQTGGTMNADTGAPIGSSSVLIGQSGNGTYNLQGGVLNTTGRVWLAEFATSTGEFNISGGTANLGDTVAVALRGNATVTQTAGDVNIGGHLRIGQGDLGGDGVYEISGGSLDTTLDLAVGFLAGGSIAGSGVLRVIGDGSSIGVGGSYFQTNEGTLVAEIGGNGLLTEIQALGNATFNLGAILEADFSNYVFGANEFWDVLTAANIVDNGINLVAPADIYYRIVSGGNGQVLQLFSVPTPAALPAGLALIGLLTMRRRRIG